MNFLFLYLGTISRYISRFWIFLWESDIILRLVLDISFFLGLNSGGIHLYLGIRNISSHFLIYILFELYLIFSFLASMKNMNLSQ